ncbi:hypothetical protein tb265_23030 [Gemmatimonadetes bacterium T265]|nr:hypothetical protein tb265_23030 [Gemmatimonadetes bacterium T265]
MAKDSTVRGLRDEATVGPDPSRARELRRLSELRYEVADGEPDVRGWTVYASTGREVGTVADLLVDTEAGEVVMLDVDLRRGDQHTFAPIRAAWIDHVTRRVVLDARAFVEAAGTVGTPPAAPAAAPSAPIDGMPSRDDGSAFPTLPRSGPLSDADIQRFNDEYVRAYGDRAADRDATWRVARGADEALRFAPRRLLGPPTAARPATSSGLAGRDLSAPEFSAADPGAGEDRRTSRIDDASALDDAAGIDPRELDARVRIDEGATVDDEAPVAGVRYEGDEHTPHDYGTPEEAYGVGYGSGRIGFNKVVSREPYASSDRTADPENARPVRYRQYDDRYAGPGADR